MNLIAFLKRGVVEVLTIPMWGFLLRRVSNSLPYFNIRLDSQNPSITDKTAAKIFWNLYERAEAELIQKYLPGDKSVIELGASLGIISSLIGSKIRPNLLLCVEPNPKLIPSIRFYLNQVPNLHYKVYQNVISYQDTKVGFYIQEDDNLTGRIAVDSDLKIDPLSLHELVSENEMESFDLVFDIEGAEVEIIIHEQNVWKQCRMIICELHETTYGSNHYTVEMLKQMIEAKGFTCLKQNGNCFAFLNNQISESTSPG